MKRFKHVFVELFGKNFYFVCCSRKQYEKMIKVEFGLDIEPIQPWQAGTFEIFNRSSNHIGVIWVKDTVQYKNAILVHELFHAVYWMTSTVGICLSESSEEVFAYSMQYLISKIGVLK